MNRKSKKPPQDLPGLIMLITFGVVVVGVASVLFYMLGRRPDFKRDAGGGHVPPYFPNAAAAQPLPATLGPSRFQEPRVQSAYAMARQKPAVLAQQPCYCGCEARDTGACLIVLRVSTQGNAPYAFARHFTPPSWMRGVSVRLR